MVCRKGFTLIEFITGFGIASVALILVASIYLAHFRLFTNQKTSIDVASQNKLALDEVTNQIRQSQTVVNTCTNCAGDTTGTNTVVLQLWPLDANGDPKDPGTSNTYDYIVYKLDSTNNNLIKKVIVDPTSTRPSLANKIVAIYVTSLSFSYNNADPTQATEVTINITTTSTAQGKTVTTSQMGQAVLRNK